MAHPKLPRTGQVTAELGVHTQPLWWHLSKIHCWPPRMDASSVPCWTPDGPEGLVWCLRQSPNQLISSNSTDIQNRDQRFNMIQRSSFFIIFPGSSWIWTFLDPAEAELAGAARASLLVRHVLAEPCVWDLGAVNVPWHPTIARWWPANSPNVPKDSRRASWGYVNQCHKLVNHGPGLPRAWLLRDTTN